MSSATPMRRRTDVSPLIECSRGAKVDTSSATPHRWLTDADMALLLGSGAVAGPYKPTKPMTLTWRTRISRAVRGLIKRIGLIQS